MNGIKGLVTKHQAVRAFNGINLMTPSVTKQRTFPVFENTTQYSSANMEDNFPDTAVSESERKIMLSHCD